MGAKPKLLFLDDRSKRLHSALDKYGDKYDVTLVPTAKECIKMLSNAGPWDLVSLDHDLCFEEFVNSDRDDCGMEVVRWLERFDETIHLAEKQPGYIIIHSSNGMASLEMLDRIRKLGYDCRWERYVYDT